MKKEIISIILVIVIAAFGFGQDCSYKLYNHNSAMALINYSQSNFKEAKKYYKLAFKKADFSLGVDLSLALETAIKTKDTIWAKDLSINLAKGGIPLEYFDSLNNMAWYDEFVSNSSSYQEAYKEAFDLDLRNKLIDLRFQDSLFNEEWHKWRKGEIEMTLDELIQGANQIFIGFKNLVKEHGFPCEQKMGYYYKEGTVQEFPVEIILIHIYQRGELFFKDRLGKIVCDGKLRPHSQALLNGFKGFGDSTGVEQEMRIRYNKYRRKE